MATRKAQEREQRYAELLKRDHTLNGGVHVGLDGHFIEIQARAVEVFSEPLPFEEKWQNGRTTTITGMATGAVKESLQRIGGAFSKLGRVDNYFSSLMIATKFHTAKKLRAVFS
ncbi:MAG: hypothetical protein H0T51_26300 [Pirellulales bacterium]|nr:hypothetical protein [Pirellulales bacterium]